MKFEITAINYAEGEYNPKPGTLVFRSTTELRNFLAGFPEREPGKTFTSGVIVVLPEPNDGSVTVSVVTGGQNTGVFADESGDDGRDRSLSRPLTEGYTVKGGPARADSERLNWLEKQVKASRTGSSLDWVPAGDGFSSGWRYYQRGYAGMPQHSLRSAIDRAMAELTKSFSK
jgi:hypothetical protein